MTEFSRHPEFGQLLALMDRDPQDDFGMRKHVRECAKCRHDTDECRAAVWDYARFEEAAILPAIPPADPWPDLRARMRRLDEQPEPVRKDWASVIGRLAGGGAALGCLAFAIVLVTHLDRHTASPAAPAVTAATPAPIAPKLDSRPAINVKPRVTPVDAGPPAVESPLNIEVRVLAVLHRLGADLGEPVEISAEADGRVIVGGTGVAPARQAEIGEALRTEPGVLIRFHDPLPAQPAQLSKVQPERNPFAAALMAFAGSQDVYEKLGNRVLDESDAVLARVHALEMLASRFPATRGPELGASERALLADMTAAHRAAFAEHAQNLLQLIGPPSRALGAPAAAPQSGDTFDAARRLDRVLSAIFGGAHTGLTPSQLLAELSRASATLTAGIEERQ
jgi:hypothetical protein